MNIDVITELFAAEIQKRRETINANLGRIADMADKPLPPGFPNIEGAIAVRTRELNGLMLEQHVQMSSIRALKIMQRRILRAAKRSPSDAAAKDKDAVQEGGAE